MYKATFINCNMISKRDENNYVNLCEQTLKGKTLDHKCLSKVKKKNPEQLIVEIIYEGTYPQLENQHV
jgi:hypothetical protein